MGNLYTLTRLKTDGSTTQPHVNVSSVDQTISDPCITLHKVNGSAKVDTNGQYGSKVEDIVLVEQSLCRQSSSVPSCVNNQSSRPATLVLRSVFPSEER